MKTHNMYREKLKQDVYLDMADSISLLSKDINTKVGAIIVAKDGTPVSWGYNGTVSGFDDSVIPHSRETVDLFYKQKIGNTNEDTITFKSNKYPFMCHAESNAIFFADREKLKGATIYVNNMPCENCAKEIARAKISKVVVRLKKNNDKSTSINVDSNITKYIFANANIKLVVNGIDINLSI